MERDPYQINEDLLQSYRQIFISTESFLLAVGAIILDKSLLLLMIIAAVSIITIWYLWFRIVRSRHLIVDYYKFNLSEYMPPQNNSESIYVHNIELRKQANKKFESHDPEKKKINNSFRGTRIKIDLILPILFTFMWVAIMVYAIFP